MTDPTRATPPGIADRARLRADSDIRELWIHYARRLTDAQLVACVGLGLLAIAGFGVAALFHARWATHWWAILLPPIFACAFGGWGIADRELAERNRDETVRPVGRRMFIALEWVSGGVAALATAAAAIFFLRLTVGTWIS